MGVMDGCFDNGVVAVNLLVLERDGAVEASRLARNTGSLVAGKDNHKVPGLDGDVEGAAAWGVGGHVLALGGELVIRQGQTVLHVGIDGLQIEPIVVLARHTHVQSVVASHAPDLPTGRGLGSAISRGGTHTETGVAVLVVRSLSVETRGPKTDGGGANGVALHIRLGITFVLRTEHLVPIDVGVISED